MKLDFEKFHGLVPAVIQDAQDGRVLMVGFMNDEAFRRTCETGKVTFFSRSRNELWLKGATSGHFLLAREILVDCDEDTLVIKAESLGPGVCHNGFRSCFYRRLEGGEWKQVDSPAYDPKSVYSQRQG
jgi:phosphoribosyl-AMP cyclohydrolase